LVERPARGLTPLRLFGPHAEDIGVSRAGIEWVVRHGRDENPAPEPQRPIYTDKWSIENEVHPVRASLMGDIRASG
jgi:hypothetical protein